MTAKLISSYTDYIIRHNTDAFRTLGFTIPEDYEHTVSPVSYNFDEQALTAVDNQWGFNDQTSTGVYVWDQSITFMPSDTREVAIRFTAPDDGVISPDGNGVIGYAGSIHDYASVESDGMRYAVYLNEKRVVPSNGLWGKILFNGGVTATPLYLAQSLNVKKGDTLTLVIENGGHGNTSYDSATALLGFFWSDSTVSNIAVF